MDNQNDFIHIDEVFKRLKDGEEPQASGSWMNMKELLDNEIPVGTPISSGGYRRYLVPLLALLFIGSAATYYTVQHNRKQMALNQIAANNTNINIPKDRFTSAQDNIIDNQNKGLNNGTLASKHILSNNQNITGNTINNHHNAKHLLLDNSKGETAAKFKHENSNVVAANKIKSVQKNNTIIGEKLPHKKANAGQSVAQNNIVANVAQPAAAKAFEEQHVVDKIYPASNSNTTNNNSNNNGMIPVIKNWHGKKISKDLIGNYYKEQRDTFKRIETVEHFIESNNNHNRIFVPKIDTVSITRVETIKYTPLNLLEMASLRKAKLIPEFESQIPMSSLKENVVAREAVNIVPLANYEVAKRKVDPSKFNELVHNSSQSLASYFDGTKNFYAAFLIGGNIFTSNPGAAGMQFGIAGLYQLSERLTLIGELKYANHYFSNYTINDQSVNYDGSCNWVSNNNWLWNGTKTASISNYKINSFSTLELPILLSYNLSRFSVFGGLNMAYTLPVQSGKSNSSYTEQISVQVSSEVATPYPNTTFNVNTQKDFNSRFALGYVAGLSYDVSRKISLDARVTQNLWTTYNGSANEVNQLFKIPVFQFSIGYFFGRKDKVMYIMDNKR